LVGSCPLVALVAPWYSQGQCRTDPLVYTGKGKRVVRSKVWEKRPSPVRENYGKHCQGLTVGVKPQNTAHGWPRWEIEKGARNDCGEPAPAGRRSLSARKKARERTTCHRIREGIYLITPLGNQLSRDKAQKVRGGEEERLLKGNQMGQY